MRNAARLKMGYYPLPESEGIKLRAMLSFSEPASAIDPCVGRGTALNLLTRDAPVRRYGVELDAERARIASANGIETIQGNAFDTMAQSESFSFLYLNPPYDSELGPFDNNRMEFLFLEHTYRWLVPGGVLLIVVQHKQVQSFVQLLAAQFHAFQAFRLTDPESDRFDQVALFGIRKRITNASYEANRKALLDAVWRNPLPALTGEEPCYAVPPTPAAQLSYRGLPLDRLEDLATDSSAWKKVISFLLPKEETAVGRPIIPLHGGHVGLLCTAGLLNGVFGIGKDRHIARWRTVKYVTTFKVKDEDCTEIHKQERFSNEVALVYEDGRTRVLTDKKKGEEDAERASEAWAA